MRDAPGTGRDPLTPVPVAEQREALDLITGSLLSADSFSVSPALQRKLGADFAERTDALRGGEGSTQTDYSPSGQVLGLQRSLLAVMMSDTVATRLLESSEKAPSGSGRALRMPELYGRLTQAVWSELDARRRHRAAAPRGAARPRQPHRRAADPSRRRDPRRHAQHRPDAGARAARADPRASHRPGLSDETTAHLADSADTLEQAMSARLQRSGA